MFMYSYENMNLFDFSDYPEDPSRRLLDLVNKKEIGKMKDEVKKN